MLTEPYNFLYRHYTTVRPDHRVLELCGTVELDVPYSSRRDDDLTAIVNAYARPDYLPLIWEGIQYQTRRPAQTWIIQNNPGGKSELPRAFLELVGSRADTVIVDSGLNHGCWFRFFLAALSCRTRYVAIYDDDTLSGRQALETALDELARQPGVYGGRGLIFKREEDGLRYWRHDVSGWPVGNERPEPVDFACQLWVMETSWLKELFRWVPDQLFAAPVPARECGEDMYVSFVAQKVGLPTFTYTHGRGYNARWSSIQAYEMGMGPEAMNMDGGLAHVDLYLQHYVRHGWKLLRYQDGVDSAA